VGLSFPAFCKVSKEAVQKAEKIIRGAVSSTNSSTRDKVAIALGGTSTWGDLSFPKDKELLLDLLKDSDEYVRIAAAVALYKKGDMSGGPVLQDILEKTPLPTGANQILVQFQSIAVAKKRAAAARALGDFKSPQWQAVLKRSRHDQNGQVRDAVAVGLAKMGDRTELIVFQSAAKDEDEGIRVAALEALAEAPEESSINILLESLSDPSGSVRAAAVMGLKNAKKAEAWREVASLLRDSSAVVRERAVVALGAFGNQEAAGTLKNMLTDENGFVRIEVARSLALLGDNSGLVVVQVGLASEDADVRIRSAESLAAFTNEKDWSEAIPALNDPDDRVQLAAALTIWTKGNKK